MEKGRKDVEGSEEERWGRGEGERMERCWLGSKGDC